MNNPQRASNYIETVYELCLELEEYNEEYLETLEHNLIEGVNYNLACAIKKLKKTLDVLEEGYYQ